MIRDFFLLCVFLFAFVGFGHGQNYLSDIAFDKIQDDAVDKYIKRQINKHTRTFEEVKPSLNVASTTEGYRFQERIYVLKDSVNRIWEHYVNTNPVDAWNAGKMNLGLLYSKNEKVIIYQDEVASGIETGQLVYLNLNVLRLKKIATAFEIINVNKEQKIIEFSYVEDNITRGKQQLHFFETGKGYTKIVHCSYFKSQSVLRDHFLYPYFHTRLTNTYHRNMKRIYKSNMQN
jgi:hypothetical protein